DGGGLRRRRVRQMARAGRCVDIRSRLLGKSRVATRRVFHRAEGGDGPVMRRALVAATTFALLAPASAFARGKFDPTTEFEQHEWIPIHLGPIDLSITKAVAYLMLASVVTILFGLFFMRSKAARMPGRREAIGELAYEVAQTQSAEQGLPTKAMGRWFPYVATLLLFIFIVNLLGFIPLPLTGETYHGVPTWGIYA